MIVATTRTALGSTFVLSVMVLSACSDRGTDAPDVSASVPSPDLAEVDSRHGVELTADAWDRIRQMAEVPALRPNPTNRVADDLGAARLGHRLFFEPRFSVDGTVSCATCHDPEQAFADGLAVAQGIELNARNTPTVLNAAHQRWLTWDGRSDSLWAQALEPMENDREMAGDRLSIVRTVRDDESLAEAYESLFGPLPELPDSLPERARPRRDGRTDALSEAWAALDPQTRDDIDQVFVNLGKSLGAYQRKLLSGDAPFDRFVTSVDSGRYRPVDEFDDAAVRGLELFAGDAGCWSCHAGPMLTTGEFHNIGVPPKAGGMPTDSGRYEAVQLLKDDPFNAAGRYSDDTTGPNARLVRGLIDSPENWGRFRTPSLREVARTAPYMHEGRFKTLEEVLRFYSTLEGAVQLDHHQEKVLEPLDLSESEISDLIAFLRSLNGSPSAPEFASPPF
ncbi:MAG TPA: hypothetical protein DCX60_09535 [Phycisphaerales bacterium]|nr:hypothetical protein [Phycisphaerales bacterium]